MVELAELLVADDPDAWRSAGFSVDADDTCRLGTVRVRLRPSTEGRGVRGWSLRGITGEVRDVDGIPTSQAVEPPAPPAQHPNGTQRIDHIVVMSPDVDRTIDALTGVGLDLRRVRDADDDGRPIRQVFFRAGEVIVELVGSDGVNDDGPARFFGLALAVADLDATAAHLGGALGRAKDAVQPGRRIATLRHRDVGISTAIAFMSPHVRAAAGGR